MPPKKTTAIEPKPKAPRRSRAKATTTAADAPTTAVLAFKSDWQQEQEGSITAGGTFTVRYEPARFAGAREIVGFARFLPGGQVRHATLLRPKRPARKTAEPVVAAADIPVPPETRLVELWFQSTDESGAIVWDSRFGENYRFDVVRPRPTVAESLHLRGGAVVDASAISVTDDAAVKANALPGGASLQTSLHVVARVKPSLDVGQVWIDVHFFDGEAALIHGDTLPLRHTGASAEGEALFALDGMLYQGTVATPGSVSPKPDVRTVQYRLYCEVGDLVLTDGVLHRCELATDAVSS
jgi:hypothetical protein